MPMYEFRCPQCKRSFEEYFDADAEKVSECPKCGSRGDRVWTTAGFTMDWVNGGWHGDGENIAFGKHFNSVRERENYAASVGARRVRA